MADYVPGTDPDFDSWQGNWVTYALANLTALGLSAGDGTAISAAQTAWRAKYDDHVAKQAAAGSATEAKDTERGTYESFLRGFSQSIQTRPTTTNAQRAALGITVPDPGGTPIPAPTTAPIVSINTSQRLRHVVHFARTQAEGGGRGKPAGVRGCQIWMKIGSPAPVSEADLTFETEDTRTPHTIDFDAADAGKLVYYWCRWVNPRGQTGPWAAPVSATIVA